MNKLYKCYLGAIISPILVALVAFGYCMYKDYMHERQMTALLSSIAVVTSIPSETNVEQSSDNGASNSASVSGK